MNTSLGFFDFTSRAAAQVETPPAAAQALPVLAGFADALLQLSAAAPVTEPVLPDNAAAGATATVPPIAAVSGENLPLPASLAEDLATDQADEREDRLTPHSANIALLTASAPTTFAAPPAPGASLTPQPLAAPVSDARPADVPAMSAEPTVVTQPESGRSQLSTRFVPVAGALLPAVAQQAKPVEAQEAVANTRAFFADNAAIAPADAAQLRSAAVSQDGGKFAQPSISAGPAVPADSKPVVAEKLEFADGLTDKAARAVAAAQTSSAGVEPGSDSLKLPATKPAQWRQPLLDALGERVQVKSAVGVDQAVIRLDPPHLGRVEIIVRQDASGMQVQLSASNAEVARQLQHIGDSLKQDLSSRFAGDVSVQVTDTSRQGDGRQPSRQHQPAPDAGPGKGLAEAGSNLTQLFGLATETNLT